jgi:hypothetical protein
MKRCVLLVAALGAAGAAMAAAPDLSPAAGVAVPVPASYNPAFGTLIRSFVMPYGGALSSYPVTGVAATYDHYLCIGPWGNWAHFVVYTTTGSLVRTVAVTTPSGGYRDGSGTCHLGDNYIVTLQNTAGPYYYSYAAGGTPGGTGTSLFTGPTGRGIAWDGSYYFATLGDWGSAIGKYTSAGSLVGSVTGPYAASLYGLGAHPDSGYLYAVSYLHYVARVDKSTGSVLQSFNTNTTFTEGGADMGPEGNALYLYWCTQNGVNTSVMYVSDSGEVLTTVAPTSLGKIKTLYR